MKIKTFIMIFSAVIVSFFAVSRITAQQEKWINYGGDFANFNIRTDYELAYKNKNSMFTYTIKDPKYPDKPLILACGHTKADFRISKKKGYKIQNNGKIVVLNTQGIEKSGTTKDDNNWREAYLYYSIKGPGRPDTRLIYVAYDEAPGDLSYNFDTIIKSIKVKDTIENEPIPQLPADFEKQGGLYK